jgi:DNA-binding YbaB/EbfC family protein
MISQKLNPRQMFGNMFGDMEERQKALKEQLAQIKVSSDAADGAIKVEANATRTITNIQIDPAFLKDSDAEELEDLLMVAINRAIELAAETEAAETQKLIQDMLPPGMGNLFGM